jgi:hypothetical protein
MSSDENRLFDVPEKSIIDETIAPHLVQEVFDLWVELHRNGTRGRRPVLDANRRKLIIKALHNYGREACLNAIRGCSVSPFHQGENARGKKYDDIELILRDATKIEKFGQIWEEKNTGGGFLD